MTGRPESGDHTLNGGDCLGVLTPTNSELSASEAEDMTWIRRMLEQRLSCRIRHEWSKAADGHLIGEVFYDYPEIQGA